MQWCTMHSFTEAQILNRFVFHLSDMAQQWYLALPSAAKTTYKPQRIIFCSIWEDQNQF